MLMHSIVLFAAALSPQSTFDKVAGVRLGDSQQSLEASWKEFGPINSTVEDGGTISFNVGTWSAKVCQGRVVFASQKLGTKFNEFAGYAQLLIKEHGQPLPTEIFSINGKRPASDPRGEWSLTSAVIRIRWAAAPAYLLQYYEIDDDRFFGESLIGENPCEKKL